MTKWHISKEQYQTLLSYVGFGDFQKSKIYVFGIEEGLGGHDEESNIVARVEKFGSFDSNGNLTSALSPPNREQGYWEPNAQSGGQKIRDYIYKRDRTLLTGKPAKGAFNEIIARMCLELEQPKESKDYWFRLMNDDKDIARKIKDRIQTLFQSSTDDLLHTALTDWKPLPRRDMKKWPIEYQPTSTQFGLDSKLYERAFSLKYEQEFCDDNTNYTEDVEKRLAILRNLLNSTNSPIMMCLGEIPTKRRVLGKIFPEAEFRTFQSTVHPTHSSLKAEIQLEARTLNIFLLPFPLRTSKEWGRRDDINESAGSFMLRYYQELTQEYFKPIITTMNEFISKS
ncbi:hypothetical protein NYE70_22195 [Paenibacillus sp. FSL R5-0407]|uniref:hypothetical protein n=1 Tax=Paenibacillus sp. FSL R5-0407 TaxID=2975320 RepID=UPI0030F5E782